MTSPRLQALLLLLHAKSSTADPAADSSSLDLLWPTPLLKLIDPVAKSANAALAQYISNIVRTEAGVKKTNLGGWQSDVDFFERDNSAVALLRTRAYHAVFRYLQAMAPPGSEEAKYEVSIGSAWANVNNRSHENSPHVHPGAQISAVYYVDDGGSRAGGVRFVDPRAQASMVPSPARWTFGTGEHIRLQAVPGLFVLFPAWLQHYVVAHDGGKPRMTVSFNVRLTFPSDDDEASGAGFVAGSSTSSAGGGAAAAAPARLSFTVPPHHQQEFLDAAKSKDMLIT